MPTMYEIYEQHADRYDALVEAEDYRGNLKNLLAKNILWKNAKALEAGVGTGRVTKIFADQVESAVCCDRSQHMLDFARQKLATYSDKLQFKIANNLDLPLFDSQFDVFIQGWSFGHSVMDCETDAAVNETVSVLVNNALKNIRPGGKIVFIETLGTNVETAKAPAEKLARFYCLLENDYGFEPHAIRTDLKYPSVDDAIYHMGFFFGPEMAEGIKQRGSNIIPEWTGVWIKTM